MPYKGTWRTHLTTNCIVNQIRSGAAQTTIQNLLCHAINIPGDKGKRNFENIKQTALGLDSNLKHITDNIYCSISYHYEIYLTILSVVKLEIIGSDHY